MHIHDIIEKIKNIELSTSEVGLLEGKMGLSLLLFCYAHFQEQEKVLCEEIGSELIEEIYDAMDYTFPIIYASGLCGVGTGIEYLLQNGYIGGNGNDALEEIDKIILSSIVHKPDVGVTLDTGIIGWGRYLLYRIKGASAYPESAITLHNKEYFIQIVDLIDYYKQDSLYAQKEIIPFLYDAYALSIINFKIEKLLRYFLNDKESSISILLDKASLVKTQRVDSYLTDLRNKLTGEKLPDSIPVGLRDGYIGMGMTWLMDQGYISNAWTDLL